MNIQDQLPQRISSFIPMFKAINHQLLNDGMPKPGYLF